MVAQLLREGVLHRLFPVLVATAARQIPVPPLSVGVGVISSANALPVISVVGVAPRTFRNRARSRRGTTRWSVDTISIVSTTTRACSSAGSEIGRVVRRDLDGGAKVEADHLPGPVLDDQPQMPTLAAPRVEHDPPDEGCGLHRRDPALGEVSPDLRSAPPAWT